MEVKRAFSKTTRRKRKKDGIICVHRSNPIAAISNKLRLWLIKGLFTRSRSLPPVAVRRGSTDACTPTSRTIPLRVGRNCFIASHRKDTTLFELLRQSPRHVDSFCDRIFMSYSSVFTADLLVSASTSSSAQHKIADESDGASERIYANIILIYFPDWGWIIAVIELNRRRDEMLTFCIMWFGLIPNSVERRRLRRLSREAFQRVYLLRAAARCRSRFPPSRRTPGPVQRMHSGRRTNPRSRRWCSSPLELRLDPLRTTGNFWNNQNDHSISRSLPLPALQFRPELFGHVKVVRLLLVRRLLLPVTVVRVSVVCHFDGISI